jgi:hypothetical protein
LIEWGDIRSNRVAYLRGVNKYREEDRPTIYEDQTFIHSSHTRPQNWTDDIPSWYVLTEKLTPILPPKPVLVVDNAPCHNLQFNNAPTILTTRAKMME